MISEIAHIRGPSNNNYDSYDLKYNGQSHRPAPNFASSGYYNPYLSKHGFYGTINPKDRISIGGGYYSGSEFSGNGYAGSDRVRPYGSPQPVDIPATGYNSNGFYGAGGGGIGGGGGYGGYGNGYDGAYDQGFDGNIWGDKMNHLSKSHLLPLAGAALIGIAAALLVNPVLLQLGTVSGKRRRRRDIVSQLLPPPKASAHNLAYRGHNRP
ncbi:peroxisomal membrane protein PEX13-like isoform X2 [Sitodiplosis mosellana]|uniref:peroxisomal membrane protein PEX13-like isoform X2 n=1 Tax=Sitodiplosis mosellana TaxID=263140 RepID=UPI002443A792|nr:peroxisomal membrane protein PEX13-like isoform X2 [Sitodiplosis mosellana]